MFCLTSVIVDFYSEHDASVAYIDDDDDDDPNQPLYQTIPYVCGRVFLASVLDSLVATVSQCY